MGSEDLHHKRKSRRKRDLYRRKSSRESYDRVLIVCEGSKTEPNYLRELIDYLRLSSANIEVEGGHGSSPISVVNHAKRRFSEEKNKGDGYDRVFCVFDKDTHTRYTQAKSEAETARPVGVFKVVPSVPCFEYWLLSHFVYSTQPYSASGGKSACANLIKELKNYIPGYAKGDQDVFDKLMSKTDQAITNSRQALSQVEASGTDNPTTRVHELVEYLQNLTHVYQQQ